MAMINWARTLLLSSILSLVVTGTASATILGYTDIMVSSEPATAGILEARYGSDRIERINDYAHDASIKNTDVEWNFLAGATTPPAFVQIAKHAGYRSEFGLIYGGEFWSFNQFLMAFGADPSLKFHLGIRVETRNENPFIWSSNSADNSDGRDHMVTWAVDEAAGIYAVAFEDLPNGGDQDFNDLILEVRSFVDGPVGIPEPAAHTLFGVALAVIGFRRRVKTHNQ